MQTKYILAERIVSLCLKKQISVEQLAEFLGKSSRTVNRYRGGQVEHLSCDVLDKMCEVFGIELRELFSED